MTPGPWRSSKGEAQIQIYTKVCDILFLASTVSALHRKEHIWNVSHPLLVTPLLVIYNSWVTVYSLTRHWGKKKISVNAEIVESFIYMFFKFYVQV